MEIQRCFEILELDDGAVLDDAKQSYKDLVNIWHPDRFSNNPRLKQKAEDKLKEINIAYEMVVSFLTSRQSTVLQNATKPNTENAAKTGIKPNASRETGFERPEAGSKNKTEAFVETGTEIVLGLFSSLYANLRRIVADVKTEVNQGSPDPRRKNDSTGSKGGRENEGRGAGKAMGRGRGMGKGGGKGGGRGRGRR